MAVTEQDVTRAAREAARQIEVDMGVGYILQELDELPARIRQQQSAVQAVRQAVEEAEGEVALAEATLTALISSETDPRTGKPLFSNDTARKSELLKRKTTDAAYLTAQKKLDEAKEAAASAQFDLDLLVNRFSAIRSLARLTTQRLRILGGDN